MTGPFSFATAGRIVFGEGEAKHLARHLASILPTNGRRSKRCLIVTGSKEERAQPVLDALEAGSFSCQLVTVSGEPRFEDAKEAVDAGRQVGAEFVIGCGGGSAIDLAKATSALLANQWEIMDYVEVIGLGRPLSVPALPCIAIPTTSGTGAEVTKNAVLGSPEHRVKVSLRHDSMLPRLAVVDPELTHSVPADVTAATGLDALTQCIEPYLSCLSNPLTDGIALRGIELGAKSLLRAFADGTDREARADMSLCSLFGGLALANAKLGAVHGFAGPFGGMFKSPHGAVCARLLPPVLRTNLAALRERAPLHPALARFDVLARVVTGNRDAKAEDGIAWVDELAARLKVPALREYGMSEDAIDELVEKAARASSMKGNPLVLNQAELERVVLDAL
jgi:alcohol dehydrogenase class IV